MVAGEGRDGAVEAAVKTGGGAVRAVFAEGGEEGAFVAAEVEDAVGVGGDEVDEALSLDETLCLVRRGRMRLAVSGFRFPGFGIRFFGILEFRNIGLFPGGASAEEGGEDSLEVGDVGEEGVVAGGGVEGEEGDVLAGVEEAAGAGAAARASGGSPRSKRSMARMMQR